MTSHVAYMALFAACVATVFGTLLRDDLRQGAMFALRIFLALVIGGIAIGWLMLGLFR